MFNLKYKRLKKNNCTRKKKKSKKILTFEKISIWKNIDFGEISLGIWKNLNFAKIPILQTYHFEKNLNLRKISILE